MRSLEKRPGDSSNLGRVLLRLVRGIARVVSARGVLYLTATIGIVLVAILTEAGGEVYEAVTEQDGVAELDQPALDTALAWRSPTLDAGVTFFTNLGGPLGMTLIASAITALMVWRWRSRTPLVLMLIAVAGSLLLTTLGKTNFGRTRPQTADAVPPFETSPSFPSGHALNSTVIAGMVAYLVFRRLERQLTPAADRRSRGALGWCDRAEPGVPGPPLAHRRDVRLAGRSGLADSGRRGPSPVSERPRGTRVGRLRAGQPGHQPESPDGFEPRSRGSNPSADGATP